MSLTHSGIRKFLLPFSFLYGMGVWIRNALFDTGILESRSSDIPVIGVGNLTVGGTGKTPMTEYLAHILHSQYQVAILSRGYKRKSKGFVVGRPSMGVTDLGDEPTQMMRKFSTVVVAVDGNRRRGIEMLCAEEQQPRIDAIILDDAFQHRYVTPGLSILLVDFNRPITHDHLLPAGNLREPAGHHKRADVVVYTKCPSTISPIERRIAWLEMKPQPFQSVYFTTLEYGPLLPVGPKTLERELISSMDEIREQKRPVLIISGIASPEPFISYVKTYCPEAEVMTFPDHHVFTQRELSRIKKVLDSMGEAQGLIITTEKDAVRMYDDARFEPLLPFCYYPSLTIRFLDNGAEEFDKRILNYVQHHKRNC